MVKNNFDVQINYIEDDLKKVQTKTNLYIQKYGDMGVFHLFKEVAQNAIDELSDPKYDAFMKSIGESTKRK
jgi:DNA gyrase/topoisomerase IV subunit B